MRWYLRENASFLNFTQQKKMFAFSNLTFLLKYFSLCLLLIMVLLHLPIHCNPMVEKILLVVPQRVLDKYHPFISNRQLICMIIAFP